MPRPIISFLILLLVSMNFAPLLAQNQPKSISPSRGPQQLNSTMPNPQMSLRRMPSGQQPTRSSLAPQGRSVTGIACVRCSIRARNG